MSISLGDVNFGVGADTTNLQKSISRLQQFGSVVDAAEGSSKKLEAQLRAQEKAAVDAAIKIQNLNAAFARVQGSSAYINQTSNAFRQFNNVMTSGTLSALEMQRAQEQFKVSLANTSRNFRSFRDSLDNVNSSGSRFKDTMSALSKSSVLISGPLGGVATRISALSSLMGAGNIVLAAYAGGAAIAATALYKLSTASAQVGATFIGYTSSLKAVTGSQSQANYELENAIKTANKAGVAIEGVVPSYIKFMAAAEGTSMQGEKAQKVFETFSKAATILNLSTDDTAGIFKALEQMISKGTVQAEELRGQLGDRLPGAFQLAARAMDVSTGKLQDMMKKGLVPTTTLLPRLEEQVRKTFNIPSGPIENYAASLGRLQNSWTLLLESLNTKFDFTGKIQAAAEATTKALDWIRQNLDYLIPRVAIFGAALAAALAPNVLTIGLLGAAIYKFGDQIQVVSGHSATFGTIIQAAAQVAAERFASSATWFEPLKQAIIDLGPLFASAIDRLPQQAQTSSASMSQILEAVFNSMMNNSIKAFNALANLFVNLPQAIASGVIEAVNFMIRAVNSGLQALASGVNSFVGGLNNVITSLGGKGIDFKVNIAIPEINNQFSGAGTRAASAFMSGWDTKEFNYSKVIKDGVGKITSATEDYVTEVMRAADAQANLNNLQKMDDADKKDSLQSIRAANDLYERQQRLRDNIAKYGDGSYSGGSDKAAKAAQKQKQALDDINEAIRRAKEQIEAYGGTEAGVKLLNEEFKRRDEVQKYAKELEKAGIAASVVKEKTSELYKLLVQRDQLKQAQEGLNQWSDAMSKSVDFFGQSLVDLALDGKDAFQSIADAAKSLAKDLLNTFIQLSVSNPLKNLLFGQSNPTLNVGSSGGLLNSLLGGLGGLFGGGSSFSNLFSSSFMPNTTFGAFLGLRKGGAIAGGFSDIPYGSYHKAAKGIVNKPTMLGTSMGVVQAGEAGTEAIMPLQKDSSGSLGVRATVSGGNNVTVNVYNQNGGEVSKKQSNGPNGDSIIDIFISKAKDSITSDIASGGTAINKAMEGRYGLAASKGLNKS